MGFFMGYLHETSQEMHRGLLEDPLLVLGAAHGHPMQCGDDHLLLAQWLHGDGRRCPGDRWPATGWPERAERIFIGFLRWKRSILERSCWKSGGFTSWLWPNKPWDTTAALAPTQQTIHASFPASRFQEITEVPAYFGYKTAVNLICAYIDSQGMFGVLNLIIASCALIWIIHIRSY